MKKVSFLKFCVLLAILPLFLGLNGRFLPLGDSLAVFRPLNLLGLGFFLLLLPKNRWRIPAIFLVVLSLGILFRHGLASPAKIESTYAIYQKNLFFRIKDAGPLAEDIKSNPQLDFVTLQEVTHPDGGLMAALQKEFPYRHTCPFASVGGTAVLSRWPIIDGTKKCFEGGGMTVVKADTPQGPIWVISTHLNWPYPHSQSSQVEKLLPQLTELDGPKIIGGDFNMVPWSYVMNAIQKQSETRRLPGTLTTFRLSKIHLGLPIDHVLAPRTCRGKTEKRPKLGSDHFGVIAKMNCQPR